MLKISVITVCKNESRRILGTLNSVASQTYLNIEWILIDGGSTDGTLELIENFKSKIHHFVTEPDQGVYSAQNKGARLATGDYLIFLNGGDFFATANSISNLLATDLNEDLVLGDIIVIDKNGHEHRRSAPDHVTLEYMLAYTLWHPTTMIKRTLFELLGPYDESLKIVADYDFFMKALCKKGTSIRHVPTTVSIFHEDGLASNNDLMPLHLAERRTVQERYLSTFVLEYLDHKSQVLRDPKYLAKLLVKCIFRATLNSLPGPVIKWLFTARKFICTWREA